MIGKAIGLGTAAARDSLARGLVKLGVKPNALTFCGVAFTSAAGVCYALGACSPFARRLQYGGANAYLLAAGLLLVLASARDMLDGAVARIGGQSTAMGAFLDSTFDRYSDFAVYAGIAAGYVLAEPANVTFALLSMLAMFNAFMISYTRARAEDLIEACRVGYWQRGERSAAILIGTFAYNVPALVVQQAILPLLTVLRRIRHTSASLRGRKQTPDPRTAGMLMKVRLWRWPRMTFGYDLVTAANIAWLLFARFEPSDVIRRLFGI